MGIDKQKNNQNNIDKLINIIDRFYEVEHFSEDGISFKFENKPNIQRVRFLLENFLSGNFNNFALSDNKDFLDIFSSNMLKYFFEFIAMDDIINDNTDFKIFMKSFFPKMSFVKKEIEKQGILIMVKAAVRENFYDMNQVKKRIEDNGKNKVMKILGNKNEPIFLVKFQEGRIYFIDVKNDKILFECGDEFEKGYKFGENKIFIFNKNLAFDFDILKNEIERFNIQNSDSTIGDFLEYLKLKYDIKDNLDLEKLYGKEGKEFLGTDLFVTMQDENILRSFYFFVNGANFVIKKKRIFLENNLGELSDLGLWDNMEVPKKLEKGYKDEEAVQIVVNNGNEKKIMVINGFEKDIFDIE